MLVAPLLDLDEIIGAGQRCSQRQQQKLGQRIDHLPRLPWVFQRREMVEQGDLLRSQGHASLPSDSEAVYESHRIRLWESRNPQTQAIALGGMPAEIASAMGTGYYALDRRLARGGVRGGAGRCLRGV